MKTDFRKAKAGYGFLENILGYEEVSEKIIIYIAFKSNR